MTPSSDMSIVVCGIRWKIRERLYTVTSSVEIEVLGLRAVLSLVYKREKRPTRECASHCPRVSTCSYVYGRPTVRILRLTWMVSQRKRSCN